ncbi:MAG: hypothetical protein ABMA15_20345 [Vicinamibacterales bacterium]
MSKKILTSLIAICASATIAAAQAPAPGAQTPAPGGQTPAPVAAPTQPAPTAAAKADSVTLEGCIQRSATSPSATPGATGTAGSATGIAGSTAGQFVLANAMKPMGTAAGSVGTAGRTGAEAASATIASMYRLDGDNAKLTPHVGHKVEVTGSVQATSTNPISAPSASASSGASAPTFKVESVKMVAASCTP